jgi:hypothetical protein
VIKELLHGGRNEEGEEGRKMKPNGSVGLTKPEDHKKWNAS